MNGKIIIGNVIWMRNDYASDISFGGITYPTLEHAFQAAKVFEDEVKEEIAEAEDVKEARRIGRNALLRSDWDISRNKVMELLIRLKFTQNKDLAIRLAKTGSLDLVMEGYDSYWGTGQDGNGENHLGKILEAVRDEVQAITGITDEDEDEEEDEESVTSGPLKAALSDAPSDELISACQQMYDGALALMTLVDRNDYDADLISRRTGIPIDKAKEYVGKLQNMQSAVSFISDKIEDGAINIFDINDHKNVLAHDGDYLAQDDDDYIFSTY